MSLQEPSTATQILQTFSVQENASAHWNKLDKCNKTPKTGHDYPISDELQKMKEEYKILERKNQEELDLIQQQFGDYKLPEFTEFQELRNNIPGLVGNRETAAKFQISNEFRSNVASEWEDEQMDLIQTYKNEMISSVKNSFITFTTNYKMETDKLADQEKNIKVELGDLQTKLDEAQRKFDLQNCLLKELEHNNLDTKDRLDEIHKEIGNELQMLVCEADIEKKRYLVILKKLIHLFQTEKSRVEVKFSHLNSDINTEKNQHFQDVEQLRGIIDQLGEEMENTQQEKEILYAENHKFALNFSSGEKQYKLMKEIDEHRRYSHELELIIKNLGLDNENLETENNDLKKQYEDKLQQLKIEAENGQRRLHEELEKFKQKANNLQEIKAEKEKILVENVVLKTNLNNIDEKYAKRIQTLSADYNEKQRKMNLQIEKQTTTIKKLNTEQADLKKLITSYLAEIQSKTDEINALKSFKPRPVKKFDKSCQLIEQTIQERDDHVIQLKGLQEIEVKNLKTEISRLQKENKDMQTKVIEQESSFKILKTDFNACLADKDQQLIEFSKERDSLIQENQKNINELNIQVAELKAINSNLEENEQNLHKQIQSLVKNMNILNYDNQEEVGKLRLNIRNQIGVEVQVLQKMKLELEEKMKRFEIENGRLKTELQCKTHRCSSLEEELKEMKVCQQDLTILLDDSKERYEDEIDGLKLSHERVLKRNKEELTKLLKDYEQQSLYCNQLDQRKKELEKLNKGYADDLQHLTKDYDMELEDLKLDLQNTKNFYENKLNHSKTEALYEMKKYENNIDELEQELKILKYEVNWLRNSQDQ